MKQRHAATLPPGGAAKSKTGGWRCSNSTKSLSLPPVGGDDLK